MKVTLSSGWLLLCLSAMPFCANGQTPATQPPSATPSSAQPSSTVPPASSVQTSDSTSTTTPSVLAPPKYTPDYTNTGSGLSIEPIYWLPRGQPILHTGDYNNTGLPGYLDYPGKLDRSLTGNVVVPAGKGASVRFSYFQTSISGNTVAPVDLNLFGNAVNAGDPLVTQGKISAYKLSYDFVTYFWNFKGGDLRLKTLYEMQYVSVDTNVDDFQPQTNGTYALSAFGGNKSIIVPTFGLGLDQTISKHFRWEARGSGWALPHRSKIGDTEFDVAARYGYVELVAGARVFYFRTSRRADHFDDGTLYGPYAGLRFYWRKK